jgi:hypothetical protein
MPAVYFHYEISPIMARFAEGRRSLSSFLTGLCAIIGAPAEIYRDRSEIDTNLCAITVARAATNLLAPHDPPPSENPARLVWSASRRDPGCAPRRRRLHRRRHGGLVHPPRLPSDKGALTRVVCPFRQNPGAADLDDLMRVCTPTRKKVIYLYFQHPSGAGNPQFEMLRAF